MDHPEADIESPLREAMRRGRDIRPAAFTDRALRAVRSDVRRRKVVRWSLLAAPLAGCAAAALVLLGAGTSAVPDNELAQVAALHDSLTVSPPPLDDTAALAAIVLADFEDALLKPRLEGADEVLADLVLGS